MSKVDNIKNLQPSPNVWRELVEILPLAPVPFYQKDLIDFFPFHDSNHDLQWYIDLENLTKAHFNPSFSDWWNESTQLIGRELYYPEDFDLNFYNYSNWLQNNTDAAASFNVNEEFVKPWKNKTDATYNAVRGNDRVSSVVSNSHNLQFTRLARDKYSQTLNKYLRLIMPKYTRRVETEDLNRNFWAISGTMELLLTYLFPEGIHTSFRPTFKEILNELLQLWENIIYLWAGAATALQINAKKLYTKVKVVYLPVPNKFFTERKFDNSYNPYNLSITDIKDRCKFLTKKYSEYNLVIVPFVRSNNYYKNYFSRYAIQYIILFDRNKAEGAQYTYVNIGIDLKITDSAIADNIYFIHEDNDSEVTYGYPFSLMDSYQEETTHPYYGLLSVKPTINAHYDTDHFVFDNFKIEVFDAAARTIDGDDYKLFEYKKNITYGNNSYNVVDQSTSPSRSKLDVPPTKLTTPFKGYIGELVSGRKRSLEPIIRDASFTIVKVGDFLPVDLFDKVDFNKIKRIESLTAQVGSREAFDASTYGLGGIYFDFQWDGGIPPSGKEKPSWIDPYTGYWTSPWSGTQTSLKFVPYYNFNNWDGTTAHTEWINTSDITLNQLKILGEYQILTLLQDGKLNSSKPWVIATKIGIGYWTGEDGFQWEHGLVCSGFVYVPKLSGAAPDASCIHHLGYINVFDGFWTQNTTIFTRQPQTNSRWRRFNMSCDSISITELNHQYTYSMKNGITAWFDHNKEVYKHIYEDYTVRPYCSMDLTSQGKMIFGQQHNTLGDNMILTTNLSENAQLIDTSKAPYQNCYNGASGWSLPAEAFSGGIDYNCFYYA